jgi:protein SCO1/2
MTAERSNTQFVLLIVSLGLLSLAAGASLWRLHEARKWNTLEALTLLPEPRVISDFELRDQHAKPFSLAGFQGHWSLLFFGYTSCPDVCPNTLYQLKLSRQLMLEQESADHVPTIYLVSVDPERDTEQKMADYLAYFDPAFVGLTGQPEQIQALAAQLGIAYFIQSHEKGNMQYTVDHTASLLLLNPSGQLQGVLQGSTDAGSIAHDVIAVIRQEGRAPWQ